MSEELPAPKTLEEWYDQIVEVAAAGNAPPFDWERQRIIDLADPIPVNTNPLGHEFFVMCPYCLLEPFDLGNGEFGTYGECPEREER